MVKDKPKKLLLTIRTTYPDVKLDYNELMLHVRAELDKIQGFINPKQ
jgi:hypothetical protein